MQASQKKLLQADLALLSIQLFWGLAYIVAKTAYRTIDPIALLGIEFTLSGLLLGVYLVFKKKSLFQNWKQGLSLGIILWVGYLTHSIGLSKISASNSAFITNLSIVLVPVAGFLLFRTKLKIQNGFAILLSLAGVWILTGGIQNFNLGDVLSLCAALAVSLHILYTDKFISHGLDTAIVNFQQLTIVGLLSVATTLIYKIPVNIGHASVIWAIVYLCLFSNIYAYVTQTVAQKYTIPVRVALIFCLEPVFTAIFSWLLHSERFAWATVIGGGLILAGLIISEASWTTLWKFNKQLL